MRKNIIMQYRINKKGKECFRSDSLKEISEKCDELKSKFPAVSFSVQSRYCTIDSDGNLTAWAWKDIEGGDR